MDTTTKNSKPVLAGLVTATAASLCCITPVLAFLGGASGFASSFSWMEPFRPYLIALTVLVFALAWYQKLKRQKQADCHCDVNQRISFWQSKLFLSMVTVAAGLLLAFPYYAKSFYSTPAKKQVVIADTGSIRQIAFTIKGMTCEGCTEHVNARLAKLKGVVDYETSYEKANSIVRFNNNITSVDSIVKAINSTGYRVSSQNIIR